MGLSERHVCSSATQRMLSQENTSPQFLTTTRPMWWSMGSPSTWDCGIRQGRRTTTDSGHSHIHKQTSSSSASPWWARPPLRMSEPSGIPRWPTTARTRPSSWLAPSWISGMTRKPLRNWKRRDCPPLLIPRDFKCLKRSTLSSFWNVLPWRRRAWRQCLMRPSGLSSAPLSRPERNPVAAGCYNSPFPCLSYQCAVFCLTEMIFCDKEGIGGCKCHVM